MNTEQERAEFEAWFTKTKAYISDPKDIFAQIVRDTAWEAWQARAALQSQEYTSAIGEAGQAYMDSFKYAHPLPVQFRWSELWEVMYAAANEGFPQSQDREDAERYRWLRDNAQLFSHFGEKGNSGWCVMRRDSAITRVFTYNGQELDEAIDHARRIEGGET